MTRWWWFNLCVIVILLAWARSLLAAVVDQQQTTTDDVLVSMFSECVARHECGLFNVCALDASVAPFFQGYIMRMANGLAQPVNVSWDVVGAPLPADVNRDYTLLAQSGHYFNTYTATAQQTIRLSLRINTTEVLSTQTTNLGIVCTSDQACLYLMQACFANTNDPQCTSYQQTCDALLAQGGGSATILKRQTCIPQCIADFYAEKIVHPYRFTSDELVSFVVPYYQDRAPTCDAYRVALIVSIISGVLGTFIIAPLITLRCVNAPVLKRILSCNGSMAFLYRRV